jgi:predicted NBD/HSP70 family sugar kinase
MPRLPCFSSAASAAPQANPWGAHAAVPPWFEWISDAGLNGAVRAFAAILTGRATSRSALASLLQVRSTTVSAWVSAMVRLRLVTELPSRPGARGRPLQHLVADPNRLTAAVLMVHSQSLHIVIVNLLGQVSWHDTTVVAPECDNAAMLTALRGLQKRALRHLPPGATLAGVSYALSGLVNVAQSKWVFAARWPRIKNLALGHVGAAGTPLHFVRNTDAQLRARCLRRGPEGLGGRTLLLHWGYGIGASFRAGPGKGIDDTAGFGEVGHWLLPDQHKRCRCGHVGCLETAAALWSIGPGLMGPRFDHAMDEIEAAEILRGMALTEHPLFQTALQEMVRAVGNLCRIFFPTDLVVSGPFVENPGAWAALAGALSRQGMLVDLPMPRLEAQPAGHQLEQEGASMPLLLKALAGMLDQALAPVAGTAKKALR